MAILVKVPKYLQRTWFEHELLLQLQEENIKVFLLFINSVDKNQIILYYSPLTQHHSSFRNLPPL